MSDIDTDDLVARLRERDVAAWNDAYSCRARGAEAADAIEALQTRVAELEAERKSDALDYLANNGQLIDAIAEARDKALEEAAKVADHIMRDYAELTYDPHHDRMQNAAKTYCAGEVAAAIRAMKATPLPPAARPE